MRVLIITNLFPSASRPRVASFNRQQFAALGKRCDVEVLATQPWYPGHKILARFATHQVATDAPKTEEIDGLSVHHPNTLHIPKFGRSIAAPLFAASLWPIVRRFRGTIDVILGAWAHPDGCASVILAKQLGVPCVIKVHGTDINSIAQLPGPRRVMKLLLPKADAIVSVSNALGDKVANLGVDRSKIHLVMNGVDSQAFHLRDRVAARTELGLPIDGKIALCIGNLIEAKGIFDLRTAFASFAKEHPEIRLYFVGDGNAREQLAAQAPANLKLVGSQPFEKIPLWLAACDLLVLPSWNEGTPNVILEALACGRRVVATRVGGIPDVIDNAALGSLVAAKSPKALAAAVLREIQTPYDPKQIAALGSRGDWDTSAGRLHEVLKSVTDHCRSNGTRDMVF